MLVYQRVMELIGIWNLTWFDALVDTATVESKYRTQLAGGK